MDGNRVVFSIWRYPIKLFEAAGVFAVLMISIYYFAQIFILEAIIPRIYAQDD
jgi:hypothetical protein